MPHLYQFRKGWERENLAQYLLSRFSFVARPVSVSDDVGTDFYCTLFQKVQNGSLVPRTSFAIQVKSHGDMVSKNNRLNITDKASYLGQLEIPFFLGVINEEDHSLTVYLGELAPRFFSFRASPSRLTAVLCDRRPYVETRTHDDRYDLDFPKVARIAMDTSEDELSHFVDDFWGLCRLMHRNLSSRANREYLFETPLPGGGIELVVYAGSESAKTFRANFMKRLTEVFFNLKQLCAQTPGEFRMDEFQEYERLYLGLKEIGYPPSEFVEQHYQDLRGELDRS